MVGYGPRRRLLVHDVACCGVLVDVMPAAGAGVHSQRMMRFGLPLLLYSVVSKVLFVALAFGNPLTMAEPIK